MRSRSIAAFTAMWLVVCGVLAMRHEASTAHVRDRAGAFVHARTLSGHHTGPDTDIHGQRNPGADTGDCTLLTASHQAARAPTMAPLLAIARHTLRTPDAPRVAAPKPDTDVYRLAPKTSPPVG